MSRSEKMAYLERLSVKIHTMYSMPKDRCNELVDNSPMTKLLDSDAEMVMHEPLSSWAEMVYESQF